MGFSYETALVTGGATGIGRSLAAALAERGASVAVADIDAHGAHETAALIAAAGRKGVAITCDVADPQAVEAMIRTAWDALGPLDLLCANAGVVVVKPLLETPRTDMDWLFGVNLFGALDTARAFVSRVREAGRPGHILFTGSEQSIALPAYLRRYGLGIYNMAKHAVLAMADVLRHELQDSNIGVSVLLPGPVQSELHRAGRNRQERFGGPFEEPLPDLVAAAAGAPIPPTIAGSEAARLALDGLERGDFFIPTHAETAGEVRARYEELTAAFDRLTRT